MVGTAGRFELIHELTRFVSSSNAGMPTGVELNRYGPKTKPWLICEGLFTNPLS